MSTEAELRALLQALDAPELEGADDDDAQRPSEAEGAPSEAPAAPRRPPVADARPLLPPAPPARAPGQPARPAHPTSDLKAAAEVFGDQSSARPPRWSGEAPPSEAEAEARPSRRRAAEGEHRLGQVIDALVRALVAAEELELRPGVAPEAVAQRLTQALRLTGGFTQFGRSAAAALMADPGVEELYIDDQQLTRRLSSLG